MIVWLNGPFGVGKTSVAKALLAAWEDSILFDPEHVGFLLRLTLPREATVDFQDLPVWRESTVDLIRRLDRHYRGPIVVPMSLSNPDYHDQIVGGMTASGSTVHQVTLMASRPELLRRITASDEGRQWRLDHLDAGLEKLSGERFAPHVWTDGKSVPEVAHEIMTSVVNR